MSCKIQFFGRDTCIIWTFYHNQQIIVNNVTNKNVSFPSTLIYIYTWKYFTVWYVWLWFLMNIMWYDFDTSLYKLFSDIWWRLWLSLMASLGLNYTHPDRQPEWVKHGGEPHRHLNISHHHIELGHLGASSYHILQFIDGHIGSIPGI